MRLKATKVTIRSGLVKSITRHFNYCIQFHSCSFLKAVRYIAFPSISSTITHASHSTLVNSFHSTPYHYIYPRTSPLHSIQSIPLHFISLHSIFTRFYSISLHFHYILFHFTPFSLHSIPFHSIFTTFYSISIPFFSFCSILFRFTSFHSIFLYSSHSISLHLIPFHYTLFHCILSILYHPISVYCTLFHSTSFHSIPIHSFHSISPHFALSLFILFTAVPLHSIIHIPTSWQVPTIRARALQKWNNRSVFVNRHLN